MDRNPWKLINMNKDSLTIKENIVKDLKALIVEINKKNPGKERAIVFQQPEILLILNYITELQEQLKQKSGGSQ